MNLILNSCPTGMLCSSFCRLLAFSNCGIPRRTFLFGHSMRLGLVQGKPSIAATFAYVTKFIPPSVFSLHVHELKFSTTHFIMRPGIDIESTNNLTNPILCTVHFFSSFNPFTKASTRYSEQ